MRTSEATLATCTPTMSRDIFRLLRVPITTDCYSYNGDVKELARKETLSLQIRLLRSEFKIGSGDEVKLRVWNEAAKVQVPVTDGVFACLHDINVNYSPWNFFVVVSSPASSRLSRWYAPWSSLYSSRPSANVISHKKHGQQGDGAANLWQRVCRALDGLSGPSLWELELARWAELQIDMDLTPEELDRLIEAATLRCTGDGGTRKAECAAGTDASPPRLKRMVSGSFLGTRNMDFLLGLPKSLPREEVDSGLSPSATVVSSPNPSFSSDTSGTLSPSYLSGKN